MKNVTIQDAIPDDIRGVREVQKQGWLCTYPNEEFGITRKDLEKKFNLPDSREKAYFEQRKKTINDKPDISHTWVAKENDKIVAYCAADKSKERRIMAIYVLPDYQGRGIGKSLMKTALNWLGKTRDVFVNCASYNNQAISFYESLGFRKTDKKLKGEVSDLPSGRRIPEVEMVLKIKK